MIRFDLVADPLRELVDRRAGGDVDQFVDPVEQLLALLRLEPLRPAGDRIDVAEA